MNSADKEELLKVLDEKGNETGRSELRSIVHEKGLYHREVALWIIDKENKKVLLQKRSVNKKSNPNKYGLCAGHVVGDQTPLQSMKAEALEEIGLNLDDYELKMLCDNIKKFDGKNNYFSTVFYIIANIPIEKFTIQEEELSEVKYFDYENLKELIKSESNVTVFKWGDFYENVFSLLDQIIN